jgi:uncharacterized protein YndB with AHSA1/START domain
MNRTDINDAIVKEIIIKAPAERVFEALADPHQRVTWWGAEGRFKATHMESDLRPGGAWMMGGTGPEGRPFTIRGEYCAIERPHLLEFTWLADFEVPATQSVVRFDLEEKDGATTVRLTHSGFASERARETYQGWPWLLSLLQAYVEKKVAGSAA